MMGLAYEHHVLTAY